MPFDRPSPSQILERIQAEMDVAIPGGFSRLRQSVEGIISRVLAMAVHELYGFLSWMFKQVFVTTAEAEYLEFNHGGTWGISRKPATPATGTVQFTGVAGSVIPAGTVLKRGDNEQYTVDSEVAFTSTTANVEVTASTAGQNGNSVVGTKLSLASPVFGVQTEGTVQNDGSGSGLSGGTEIESDDDLRSRILERIQKPPQGGSESDYVRWMKEVSGVTRAWAYPNQLGLGTVVGIFVMDNKSGTIIPSAGEVGDVQDYIDDPERKPATADVTIVAPTAVPMNLEIHISPSTAAIKAAIEEELKDLIQREAIPGGTLYKSRINEAISVAKGEFDHILITPSANVVRSFGEITTLGTITWGTI